MAPTEKRKHWQEHVIAWRASGQTQVAYSREHNLASHTLSYWHTKLNRAERAPAKFLPLTVDTRTEQLTLELPYGLRCYGSASALSPVIELLIQSAQQTSC